MKTKKITYTVTVISLCLYTFVVLFNMSCVESQKVAMKSGAQLWSENCMRCHNTPSPTTFSSEQWETIGMHMQSRALLTEKEKNKIVEFLQSAGH